MNKYSLEDLNVIFNCKMYLTRDRFVHYFTTRFGYTEKDASDAFRLFLDFPRKIYGTVTDMENIDKIIPLAIQITEDLHKSWSQNSELKNINYDDKLLRKLIYEKDGEQKELVLNLHDSNDIITYAELLKQGIKQIALLSFCCDIDKMINDKNEKISIFEGDFFDTNDKYWGNKSNVYVAEKNEVFRKLIYIKGKGYLIKGELNIDEDKSYNSYALRLDEWTKMGNVTTDLIKLTD